MPPTSAMTVSMNASVTRGGRTAGMPSFPAPKFMGKIFIALPRWQAVL